MSVKTIVCIFVLLLHFQTHVQEGSQIANSVYSIVPDQLDDQREITCKAENPQVRGKSVEDTMILSVMCKQQYNIVYFYLKLYEHTWPHILLVGGDVIGLQLLKY